MSDDTFPYQDAIEAWRAVGSFWAALGADDDDAARNLFYEPSRERNGMSELGLADQLRRAMRVSVAECRLMGVSTTVRVLPGDRWAFLSVQTTGTPVTYDEPAIVYSSHMWIVIRGPGGGWQLWGAPDEEDVARRELVQLPILPNWGSYAADD